MVSLYAVQVCLVAIRVIDAFVDDRSASDRRVDAAYIEAREVIGRELGHQAVGEPKLARVEADRRRAAPGIDVAGEPRTQVEDRRGIQDRCPVGVPVIEITMERIFGTRFGGAVTAEEN